MSGVSRTVLIAAILATACSSKPAEEEPEIASVPTITASIGKVERRTLIEELTTRGSVTALPNQDVKVSALVAGRVNAVTVAEGDSVREGQVIARIDTRTLEDQRRQASAAVQQATVQLDNARLNLQRNEQLFSRGIAAGKEVEDAKGAVAEAEGALAQANAALNAVNLQVERADVRAPISGRVVKRMVSVGEQVDGTAAQPLVQIANLDKVELAANIPSDQLSRIKIGQMVTVVVGAYPDRPFPGRIIAIAPSIDAATNTALARIRVDNANGLLRVGMFAEGRIQLQEHVNVLTVPRSALVRDDEGAAVYVVTGDVAKRTKVTTGIERDDVVEIQSGVTENQSVLASAVYGLGDEAKITLAKPS